MSNIAYDTDLNKYVFANRSKYNSTDERIIYPDAIPYDKTNRHHKIYIKENDKWLRACFVNYSKDKNGHERSEHFAIVSSSGNSGGQSLGVSELHRNAEMIIRKRYRDMSIVLNGIYPCEFDDMCPHRGCLLKLSPEDSLLPLSYYDEMLESGTKSRLFPTRTPDIFLRRSDTGEELWLEINAHHAQTMNPDRIHLGVPIAEIDVFGPEDLINIEKWIKLSTDRLSRFNGKPFAKSDTFRVFNPWNFPNFNQVQIPCSIYTNNYDLRPQPIKQRIKKHYFYFQDGRRILGAKGDCGLFLPVLPGGKWGKRSSLPAGYTERDEDEEIVAYKVIKKRNE